MIKTKTRNFFWGREEDMSIGGGVEIVRYGDVCHLTGEVKYFLSKVNV
jgi:hypothetical protein